MLELLIWLVMGGSILEARPILIAENCSPFKVIFNYSLEYDYKVGQSSYVERIWGKGTRLI